MNDKIELSLPGTPIPEELLQPATLADGPAPAAPQPPVPEDAVPDPVFAQPAPAGKKGRGEKPPRPDKPPVRRVGTFTLGVALILTGLCITASFIMPGFDIVTVAKMAPLVLVALGLEILWVTARHGSSRLKYDFLSMFVCFILICASLAAACVPVFWKYYGPERDLTEYRLAHELEQKLYEELSGLGVSDCDVYVNLSGMEFDKDMTVSELTMQDQVHANLTLSGDFKEEAAFVTAGEKVLPVLRQNGVNDVNLYAQSDTDRWEATLYGTFSLNAAGDDFARHVSHEIYVTDADGDSYWYDAQAWANKAAYEEEMRQQMAREQAQDEAYQNGYQAALADYGLGEEGGPQAEPDAQSEPLADGMDAAA